MKIHGIAVGTLAAALGAVACDLDVNGTSGPVGRLVDLFPTLTIPLEQVDPSSATGTALLISRGGLSSVVSVTLAGLAPGSEHAGFIYDSTCTQGVQSSFPLQPITAGANGDGSAVTTDVPDALLASGFRIQYHDGVDPLGVGIVCGDIPQEVASGVFGVAGLFEEDGPSTRVVVVLVGLEPGSTHAGFVREGKCATQGSVVHTLPPITALPDGTGRVEADDVPDDLLLVGFFIQYHEGSGDTPEDPVGFGVACGDILVPPPSGL